MDGSVAVSCCLIVKKKRKEPLPTRCLPDLPNREEEGSKEQMIGWMEG